MATEQSALLSQEFPVDITWILVGIDIVAQLSQDKVPASLSRKVGSVNCFGLVVASVGSRKVQDPLLRLVASIVSTVGYDLFNTSVEMCVLCKRIANPVQQQKFKNVFNVLATSKISIATSLQSSINSHAELTSSWSRHRNQSWDPNVVW